MRRHHGIVALACLTLTLEAAAQPDAYEVLQWDPGIQEYVGLGVIHPYETASPAATYYNFSGGNPSFTDPAPPLTSDRSHLFLVDSAADGLCIGFVHDKQGDGSGGEAEVSLTVSGDPDGMSWLVQDGPPATSGDVYTGSPGGSAFTACHTWPGANSDGGMLGSLDGPWTLDVVFTDVCASFATSAGLTSWVVFSCDGIEVPLVLVPDRPVRLRPAPPAALTGMPATLSLTTGGVQTLALDAGLPAAGAPYFLAGSFATSPGIPLGCYEIPLAQDAYFSLTLQFPNTFPLTNSLGVLDANGTATALFTLPSGLGPGLNGVTLHHAYIAVLPGLVVSNTTPVTFTP